MSTAPGHAVLLSPAAAACRASVLKHLRHTCAHRAAHHQPCLCDALIGTGHGSAAGHSSDSTAQVCCWPSFAARSRCRSRSSASRQIASVHLPTACWPPACIPPFSSLAPSHSAGRPPHARRTRHACDTSAAFAHVHSRENAPSCGAVIRPSPHFARRRRRFACRPLHPGTRTKANMWVSASAFAATESQPPCMLPVPWCITACFEPAFPRHV